MKRIDYLVQRKATGNARYLANKLEVSERTVKEFIAIMKEYGAPIYYDRVRNSYCYAQEGSFNINFTFVQ
jgi:predicted DNA-binding transcriptional regulator YafY